VNEYAFIKLMRPEAGRTDLAPSDPRRCRYYVRATNEIDARKEAASRWKGERTELVAVRDVVIHEFPEDKPARKAQKAKVEA
jgi:hypothetical protein